MEPKKVSVIMGVYNEQLTWVEDSISSILNQSYNNIEFIIVLDNPNNNILKEYLLKKSLEDNRVKIIINEKNLGLVKTLNLAINKSSGEYIARMDADDISYVERIKVQVNYLNEHNDIAMVGSKIEFINEEGESIQGDRFRPCSYLEIKRHLKYYNAFAHPTMMYRSNIIKEINAYSEIECAEDYELAIRFILAGYKVANLDKVLLKYRLRATSISQSNRIKQFIVSEYIKKIYRKNINGDYKKFDIDELNRILNDKKIVKSYDKYLCIIDKCEKEKKISNYIKITLVCLSDKYALRSISEKISYYIQRKVIKLRN